MNHAERITIVSKKLPEIAQRLVKQHLDQHDPWNVAFSSDLDNPKHHKPEWHQWGILTHTAQFLKAYRAECKDLFHTWNMLEKIETYLSDSIGGIPKSELIEIGILFHDLGKFTKRHLSINQTQRYPETPDFSFGLHEAESERLLHEPEIYSWLSEELGLSSTQTFYIGRVGALHYELAKIRDRTKYIPGFEYSFAYLDSDAYSKDSLYTWRQHPHFGVEMGVLYLGDTLAKTEFRLSPFPASEDEASSHIWEIVPQLEQKDIDPRHIAAVITQPLSIHASRRYLEHVFAYMEKIQK